MVSMIYAVLVGVFIGWLMIPRYPLTQEVDPNDLTYDFRPVSAPAATGWQLKALAWVMTSRLGPTVARHLLDGNNVHILREFGAALDGYAPLYFPITRVHPDEWEQANRLAQEDKEAPISGMVLGASTQHNSVLDYAAAYRDGTVTPTVVMQRTLAAIRRLETSEKLIIFAHVDEAEVLAQAAASTARLANEGALSIWDGVPIAFKDMVEVHGLPVCNGQGRNDCTLSKTDDPAVVARFRALGAIILGTTVMTEGGVTPLGYSAHWQGPTSAFSSDHYSGGSSSGSGVAVATNLVPLAIGYDGGGSVRIPASFCGIHGLATTFGRVPFATRHENTMIKSGPMTHNAHDAALALQVMAEHIPGSHYSVEYDGDVRGPPPFHLAGFEATEDLSGVRLGVYDTWFDDSDPAIVKRCREALDALVARGAEVVPISIPHLWKMSMAHALKISTEFAIAWDNTTSYKPESLEANTAIQLQLGSVLRNLEVDAGQKIRRWGANMLSGLYKDHRLSAIVTPTVSILPPVLSPGAKATGESNTSLIVSMMKYIYLANFLGLPGHTAPVGTLPHPETQVELPVGLHFLGAAWSEHVLLRLGNALDDVYGGIAKAHPSTYFISGLLDPERA